MTPPLRWLFIVLGGLLMSVGLPRAFVAFAVITVVTGATVLGLTYFFIKIGWL